MRWFAAFGKYFRPTTLIGGILQVANNRKGWINTPAWPLRMEKEVYSDLCAEPRDSTSVISVE
jgi:hypothetical protein